MDDIENKVVTWYYFEQGITGTTEKVIVTSLNNPDRTPQPGFEDYQISEDYTLSHVAGWHIKASHTCMVHDPLASDTIDDPDRYICQSSCYGLDVMGKSFSAVEDTLF